MKLAFLGALLSLLGMGVGIPAYSETKFTFRLQGEPETLDWNRAHTPIETHLIVNLMEGLVSVDSALQIQPALAESWKLSKDRLTYTFKLRDNLRWSDGVPVVAEDFVTSWRRLLLPETAAAYAYFLFDVKGAEDFNRSKLTDFSKVGIRALNKRTLEVHLRTPVAHWLYIPSYWVTFPLRQDILNRHKEQWTSPGKMVTTGPFMLSSYELNTRIILKANPQYYGKTPHLDTVVAQIVAEDTTALQLFQTGKLDFMTDFPILDGKAMRANPAFRTYPYLKTAYLGFALSPKITTAALKDVSNLHLRRAIAMSIDRTQIGEILQGGQTPGSSFVPPPMPGYSPTMGLAFNPSLAKAEFKLAQLASPPTLELLVLNWEKSMTVGQYIQQQLKTHLGISVILQPFDNKTYRAQLDLHRHPLFLASWSADYPDPDNFMSILLGDSGNNRPAWHHSAYDQQVLQARQMPSSPKRTALYAQLQKLVIEQEAVLIPLYYEPNIALVNPRVHGLKLNPLNYLDLRGVELSDSK